MINAAPALVRPPLALQGLRAWLVWRFVRKPGKAKPDKVPFYASGAARSGIQGSPSDRAGLVLYESACNARDRGNFDGVGIAMLADWGVVALDFDNCVSAGVVDPEVEAAVADAYAEMSPSGKGVRAFFRGTLLDRKDVRSDGVFGFETFHRAGFVTVTGNVPDDWRLFYHPELLAPLSQGSLDLYESRFGLPMDDRAVRANREFNVMQAQSEATDDTLSDLASAVDALPAKRADDRGPWIDTLHALASLKGTRHEHSALEIARAFSARSPKHRDDDFEKVWAGMESREITYKSIFRWAEAEGGWVNPRGVVAAVLSHANDESAEDHSMSDVRISRMLADHLSNRFVYQHSGRGWMTFREGAWQRCALAEQVEEGKKLGTRILAKVAQGAASLDAEKAKRAMALALRAMGSSGITAALNLAQSDPKIAVRPEQFDVDHDLLNVLNGVVHLPTGELRKHDPVLFMSRQCTVNYRHDASCPTWLRVLAEVSGDDDDWIDYLHRMAGYTLCGYANEEKLFFWLGHGANGKSLLANVIRRIMGSYAVSVGANFLVVSQREGEAATPTLATLPGVRLALANEVESGSRLSAQMVKVACSSEAIGARHNYGAPFSFVPTHKIWVRANHKPIIADNDEGIWRRIDLLPFERNFSPDERDTSLEEKLMLEAPGILAWLVRGYGEYKRRGLKPARRVAAASAAYRKESDLLGQWIDEEAETGEALACQESVAFASYRYWCSQQGVRPLSKKSFTRCLVERGIAQGRQQVGVERQRVYVGLRVDGYTHGNLFEAQI